MTATELPDQSHLFKTQVDIAGAPWQAKLLVLAGPGTGKTHTLVYRVVNLVQNQNLMPSSELLVLSFSRTAVAEIRRRISSLVLSGAHDDLRFLNVRTFDSFATRLLILADEDLDLSRTSYDDRIRLAVTYLSKPTPSMKTIVDQIHHVIIDEIQDLVGVRAQLVQQIVDRIDGGFTMFGDPAQGIFDYLATQQGERPTSVEFLSRVKDRYGQNLVEYSLDQNFRILTPSAGIASSTRKLILGSQVIGQEIFSNLQEMVGSLEGAGSVEVPDLKRITSSEKSVALLCRTNSDVLFATSNLVQHGVPCITPPHKAEQGLPTWIARVFGTYEYDHISRSVFDDRWRELIAEGHEPNAATSWETLKSIEDNERNYLDLGILRSRLRKGVNWVFDSESYNYKNHTLITTIHQSKGREYDHVMILTPEQRRLTATESNALEEAKVLYVAATRARESISRLEREGMPISLEMQFPSRKERESGQDRAGKHLIEVLPEDMDWLSYVHQDLFPKPKLVETVQSLLWKHIVPGTQLNVVPQTLQGKFKLIITWINPSTGKPIPLAWLSDQFTDDLKYFWRSLPNSADSRSISQMEGIHVYERLTIVLPPYTEKIHEPWASSGFCIGLGIKGALVID
jgi:hypothetical protein